jgi:hypothetical protein
VRLYPLPALALLGCGRFGFEPQLLASDALVTPACPLAVIAPDSLTITGSTFRYISFDNQTADVPDVDVSARIGASAVVTVRSGSNGAFRLDVPTGGVPVAIVLVAARLGDYTTAVHSDIPYDRPATGTRSQTFTPGDMPIWSGGSMASVYTTGGESLDSQRGTINVAVRDCAGSSVAGVSVTITPAPRRRFYQDATGQPGNTTGTKLPYTNAIALGAVPGLTRIEASGAGLVFPVIEVPVLAGDNNTLVVIHGAPPL